MDLHACLAQPKHALDIGYNICKNSNNKNQIFKNKFIYDNI